MQEPNGYGAWLLPADHVDDDAEDDDDDDDHYDDDASPRDHNYQYAVPDIVFLRHRSSGWYGRSMRYNKTIRSETREAWNKNGMDDGGVLFFLVARAVCACIYLMVPLLLLC